MPCCAVPLRRAVRRGQKKKKVAAEEHDSDSEHAEFDASALREHEEFTKVRWISNSNSNSNAFKL